MLCGSHEDKEAEWPFVYMGENEMKFNLSLKVHDKENCRFIILSVPEATGLNQGAV